MKFTEALIASLGIMAFGWVSIPLAAWAVGVTVTVKQGAEMGLIFFALRLVWLYALRCYFDWRARCKLP